MNWEFTVLNPSDCIAQDGTFSSVTGCIPTQLNQAASHCGIVIENFQVKKTESFADNLKNSSPESVLKIYV